MQQSTDEYDDQECINLPQAWAGQDQPAASGQPYFLDIGRTHVLVQDRNIRIVNAATGELLRELVLDPTVRYQPTGRPPGPTPKTIMV